MKKLLFSLLAICAGTSVFAADGGFLTRVGRSLAGESLVGVAVLLVAAILVDSRPPAQPAKSPASTQAVRR